VKKKYSCLLSSLRRFVLRKSVAFGLILAALFLGRVNQQKVSTTVETNDLFPGMEFGLNHAYAKNPNACAEQGCASAKELKELTETIQQLQMEIDTLKVKVAAMEKTPSTSTVDKEAETAAQELLKEVQELVGGNDIIGAKLKLKEFEDKYANTRTYRRSQKIGAELEVYGKPAPKKLQVDEWYKGDERSVNLNKGTTILVFWEVWCPHCKREIPLLQNTFEEYRSRGLQVVGLTKLSRSSTKESVVAFLNDNGVNYPIAKENGEMSKYFNVSGIPAAAVVKDGIIVWRGHPARLTLEMLESWL